VPHPRAYFTTYTYVENLMPGCESEEAAIQFLIYAGFNLLKLLISSDYILPHNKKSMKTTTH